MTSSGFLRQGARHDILHDGYWKSDLDFLIVIHSKFLSAMHGFWDNEVLLQAGYDVIVISPQGGASGVISWRFWKSGHDFLLVIIGNFCPNSSWLDAIQHLLFAWDFPTCSEILDGLGEKNPKKWNIEKLLLKGHFLESIRVFWAIVS